jgi:non-ribosomal peptide synthetase-like protein
VQLLLFIAYAYLGAVILDRGYLWISGASDWFGMYLRSVVFGGVSLLGLSILPIVAKWALVGRWKPGQIRIWTPAYLRFWLVKTLIRANPLLLFAGERGQTSGSSPLVTLYLRALGAKVGRGVAIYSRNLPVCTDLLTIGDGSVIRKDTFFNGYRAHDGVIQTGAVTLGRDVFIGEATVLDIGTAMGDGSQLGHSSALQTGQVVPAGERWHGSPAQPGDVDYRGVGPASCGPNRRAFYVAGQLFNMLFIYVPLATIGAGLLLAGVPQLNRYLATDVSLTGPTLYRDAAIASAVLFCGAIIVGLLFVRTFPRLLNRFIEPGRTYPLYGFHYGIHRTIGRLTNVKFFTALFGDSSYIVHYLRWIGYDLSTEEQTGSNFGTVVKHETPYHVSVGKGTMSADALSIVNADFSSTSFRVAPVSIGAHNFFGNGITYPSQGRTGENCLIGTKTLVPIGGEVRENIGLLGSPSFEIPRTVLRDSRLAPTSEEDFRRRLRVKNHYNLRSMGLFLLMRWGEFFGITVLAMIAADIYQRTGSELAVHVEILAVTLFIFAYGVLAECGIRRFRPLQPQTCSIYDPYFRWHERFWKFALPGIDKMLVGTPFKNILNRLLGVKVGRMVFDDGAGMPERTLVEIGDHCTLNEDSHLQAHSQEDGAFKSDRIRVGAGCTLGVGAFAHYGVTLEDGAVLAAGSFLMKGEEVPAGEHWAGHPAVAVERLPQPLPSGGLQPPPGSSSRPTDRAALSVKPAQHTGARHRSSRPQDRVAPGSVPLPRSDGRHRAGRRPAEAQQR